MMQCSICKQGETQAGVTTVTLTRENTTVVIKEVPADICENCGEYYLSQTTADSVYKIAEQAFLRHEEISVLRFAA